MSIDSIKVPISKGLFATVDPVDYPLVSGYTWHANKGRMNKSYYAATRIRMEDGRLRFTSMHRMIMKPGPGLEVDHADGDGLNNLRQNLRICIHGQNMINAGRKGANRFKGVSESGLKFTAKFRNKYIGTFGVIEDAARAYNAAAQAVYGEFARLNQV